MPPKKDEKKEGNIRLSVEFPKCIHGMGDIYLASSSVLAHHNGEQLQGGIFIKLINSSVGETYKVNLYLQRCNVSQFAASSS